MKRMCYQSKIKHNQSAFVHNDSSLSVLNSHSFVKLKGGYFSLAQRTISSGLVLWGPVTWLGSRVNWLSLCPPVNYKQTAEISYLSFPFFTLSLSASLTFSPTLFLSEELRQAHLDYLLFSAARFHYHHDNLVSLQTPSCRPSRRCLWAQLTVQREGTSKLSQEICAVLPASLGQYGRWEAVNISRGEWYKQAATLSLGVLFIWEKKCYIQDDQVILCCTGFLSVMLLCKCWFYNCWIWGSSFKQQFVSQETLNPNVKKSNCCFHLLLKVNLRRQFEVWPVCDVLI